MWHVLIPARLKSTRLPNKPLLDIGGVPMVVRVAQQALALKAKGLPVRVVVAADDARIVQMCSEHGVQALLTDTHHPSGSDRLAQAAQLLGLTDDDLVVNVQGDEPLIPPDLIAQVALALQNAPQAVMATAVHEITDVADFVNPNVVKVVCDAAGMAQTFSRAPIPWQRDVFAAHATHMGQSPLTALPQLRQLVSPMPLRHIGIYAYRAGFLKRFPSLSPSPVELQESLEQLRVLWHGYRIAVCTTPHAPATGVDTPEDLLRVREIMADLQGSDKGGNEKNVRDH